MFFDNLNISWLLYIIIVIISVIILVAIGIFMVYQYYMGRALAPFFWLRIKNWTQKGIALFQIFSLTNNVTLEEARKEKGDGYKLYTPTQIEISAKKVGKLEKIYNYMFRVKSKTPVVRTNRVQNLILPKSTYSINGVNTIPLIDFHPVPHADIIEGLQILIEKGIKNLEDFSEFVKEKDNAEQIMFKDYSYRTFYELYLSFKQKYDVKVTTDDVINFIGKNFDKGFRETIENQEFILQQVTKKNGDKWTKWGWICLFLVILAISFKIIYTTIYR